MAVHKETNKMAKPYFKVWYLAIYVLKVLLQPLWLAWQCSLHEAFDTVMPQPRLEKGQISNDC